MYIVVSLSPTANVSIVFFIALEGSIECSQCFARTKNRQSDKEEQNYRTSGNSKGPAEHAVKTKEVKVKSEVSVTVKGYNTPIKLATSSKYALAPFELCSPQFLTMPTHALQLRAQALLCVRVYIINKWHITTCTCSTAHIHTVRSSPCHVV